MFQNLTGWHALIILAVVILIFGAAKLPALAKSVGQSMRILKNETHSDKATNAEYDARTPTGDPAYTPSPIADPEQPTPLRPTPGSVPR